MHPAWRRRIPGLRQSSPAEDREMTAPPAYKTLEDAIGHTPLVRLQRVPGERNERRGNVTASGCAHS